MPRGQSGSARSTSPRIATLYFASRAGPPPCEIRDAVNMLPFPVPIISTLSRTSTRSSILALTDIDGGFGYLGRRREGNSYLDEERRALFIAHSNPKFARHR